MIAVLQLDPTVSIGTMVHLLVLISTMIGVYYRLSQKVATLETKHDAQHFAVVQELGLIKNRLGCAEESAEGQQQNTLSLIERLARVESDVAWLKKAGERK